MECNVSDKLYIDRTAAIMTAMNYDGNGNAQDASQDIASALSTIPAADVQEVVHARWKDVEVRFEDELKNNPVTAVASMFCPKCKRWHNEVYFYGNPVEMARFCGFCGAKMGGKRCG